MVKKKTAIVLGIIMVLVAIFSLGSLAGYFYSQTKPIPTEEKYQLKQLVWLNEIYDLIKQNYWQEPAEQNLEELFVLATEKIVGQPQNLKNQTKDSVFQMLTEVLDQIENEDKKNQFAATLADMVLANLKPLSRSRLYTQTQEQALSDTVKNINPEADLYQTLEVDKQASAQEIESAYQAKKSELVSQPASESASQLAQLEQAHNALKDEVDRQRYDESGIEPTINWQVYQPDILHIHLTKFSPTTVEDLQQAMQKASLNNQLKTLVFDLRDNIGGAIDYLPVFLGPFIGQNQYAYQFFHQGESVDFKTKTGWMPEMVRYKQVVILINENTQSSAEVVVAVLKKYNVGILVGWPTKGWGTVERVFPLENQLSTTEKHSVFLVHSLTLRDDGQPIEENGVLPLISLTDSNWPQQLNSYFNYPRLTEVIKQIVGSGL